jgi:hypothetical protein
MEMMGPAGVTETRNSPGFARARAAVNCRQAAGAGYGTRDAQSDHGRR